MKLQNYSAGEYSQRLSFHWYPLFICSIYQEEQRDTLFSLADEVDFEVLVKSQWEADGFSPHRASVFHCHLCPLMSFSFWWAKPNSAISELLTCILIHPVLLLYLLLLRQSHHWESIFLQYFLSLTSLTVSVTSRSSEDQCPWAQHTQSFKAVLPLAQRACLCLVPSGAPLGLMQGVLLRVLVTLAAAYLIAQKLCFTSWVYIPKVKGIFVFSK